MEYDNEENTPADDSNNGSSIAGGDGRNDNNCATITEITGLTKDGQRLIYRGRIIGTGNAQSEVDRTEGDGSQGKGKDIPDC